MKISNLTKLIIAVAICELAGIFGSFFTMSEIPAWYSTLVKPTFSPPNWIFGPVWITLYALMGIAAFLIWKKGLERKDVQRALRIFIYQLVLNTLWSIIFFGMHNPGGAFVEIILLWLAIIFTIIYFYKISRVAAYLLVPYLLWVTFAAILNYSIFALN